MFCCFSFYLHLSLCHWHHEFIFHSLRDYNLLRVTRARATLNFTLSTCNFVFIFLVPFVNIFLIFDWYLFFFDTFFFDFFLDLRWHSFFSTFNARSFWKLIFTASLSSSTSTALWWLFLDVCCLWLWIFKFTWLEMLSEMLTEVRALYYLRRLNCFIFVFIRYRLQWICWTCLRSLSCLNLFNASKMFISNLGCVEYFWVLRNLL